MTMSRVLIVQETLPHYRVLFFDELAARLRLDGIELEVVHGRPSGLAAEKRDQAVLSRATVIQNRRLGPFVLQRIGDRLRTADLVIVEHANRHALNYLLSFRRYFG